MIILAVVVVVVVLLVRARARRKGTLSGLNGDRPVFHLEPAARRMGSRKGERL